MEGTPPPPTSSPGYEFDAAEDEVIRRTGSRAWIWGLIVFLVGLLQALFGVLFVVALGAEGELAAGVAVFVIYGAVVLIPILVGLYFMRAGRSMKAVVTTAGSDIEHLMGAMTSLGKAFLLQIVATVLFVLLWVTLVAISVPKFGHTRERAYLAALKSDLRNLQSAQEIYYGAGSYRYSDDLARLEFHESEGVTLRVTAAGEEGWAAAGTHAGLGPDVGCAVYAGDVQPPRTAGGTTPEEPGVVVCDEP